MSNLFATIGGAVLFAAPVLAQAEAAALLQRAVLIEHHEGDLRQAEGEYRKLLDSADGAVADAAALHLGELLWRLDRQDDARPLLERVRAAGGALGAEAAAVLQGQDPAGKQAQELAAKVGQLLERRMRGPRLPASGDELVWLGAAVVPECGRRLAALRDVALAEVKSWTASAPAFVGGPDDFLRSRLYGQFDPATPVSPAPAVHMLARCLFEVGGAAAAALVREQLRDPAPEWRRLIAAGSERFASDGSSAVHESMLPVIAELLRDPDPVGVVPAMAMRAAMALPFAAFARSLQAECAVARDAAWRQLPQHPVWNSGDWGPRGRATEAVELVLPTIERALAGGDPGGARAAFAFLRFVGGRSERGSELLLQWLPKVPAFEAGGQSTLPASLASLLACAKVLGPANAEDGLDDRRRFVAGSVGAAPHNGGSAGLVLDLVELRYDALGSGLFAQLVLQYQPEPADLVRLCALLGRCAGEAKVVADMVGRHLELPAAAVPLLAARLQALLATVPERTAGQAIGDAENEIANLAVLLGCTGDPVAVEALAAVVRRSDLWWMAVPAAIELGRRCPDPRVGQFLVDRMVDARMSPTQRNDLFGALVERGEPLAISAYATAYQLGLDGQRVEPVGPVRQQLMGQAGTRGMAWLRAEGHDRYAAEQRLAIWQSVLASEAWFEALSDVGEDEPAAIQVAILEALPALARAAVAKEPDWRVAPLRNVLAAFARTVPADDTPASLRHRAAFAAVCDNDWLCWSAIEGLRDGAVIQKLADHLVARLHSPYADVAYEALVRYGQVPVPAADVIAGLRHAGDRIDPYLQLLPRDAAPEIVRAVEGLLGSLESEGERARIAACKALGRFLAPGSAPALLTALRDASGDVRSAATEALQQIRLYHEQKAYWDQFATGIQPGREAAAGKLLAQAKPDQPKDQRLLALGSLGVLGAAEALPYLIDWTKDADAEVAAAARAAIEPLQRAAAARPAGK